MSEYTFGTHELRERDGQWRGAIWGRATLPNAGSPAKRIIKAAPQDAAYDQIQGYATIFKGRAIYVLAPDIPAFTQTYEWGTHQKAVYESQNCTKTWGSISGGRLPYLAWNFTAEGQEYKDPPSSIWTKAAHFPVQPSPRSMRLTGIDQQNQFQPAAVIFKQQPRGADVPPIARFKFVPEQQNFNVNYSSIRVSPKPQTVPDIPTADLIPDQIATWNTGTVVFNLSGYFHKAVVFAINPAIETGWTFDTNTAYLTIETNVIDSFGPFTITATNGANSVITNAFDVIVRLSTFITDSPVNTNTVSNVPSNYEIDDRTGFRELPGTLKKEWDGFMVRAKTWAPRHPQDFVRGVPERHKGSERPEPEDRFIEDNDQVDPDDL